MLTLMTYDEKLPNIVVVLLGPMLWHVIAYLHEYIAKKEIEIIDKYLRGFWEQKLRLPFIRGRGHQVF